MESTSKRLLKHQSSLPVLPTVLVSIVMVAFLVFGSAADKASAKASGGRTLSGSTSQGNPGFVKPSRSGLMITKASITISLNCSFGAPLLVPQKFISVPVTPSGRFKATVDESEVDEGVSTHLVESFSGKFNRQRTRVVTKSRIYISLHAPDGSVVTCDSGIVTLHAHS